ncbi:MAG: hypothetical protein KAI24_11920, partial [Planctomycetes bacterium]|nr:hypothetical protein [Planctomycetota bacterium]
ATFSSELPEPLADRVALGDVRPAWSFAEFDRGDGSPSHLLARALHLSALHVPGATIASVVWLNVLLALLLTTTLFGLARRAFPVATAPFAAGPLLFAVLGLLVASPSFGANWLHGQRVGAIAAPLLLVVGLAWLQGERRVALRCCGALLVAAAAALCHGNGTVVFVAMIPAMAAAGRRGSRGGAMAWIGALLVVGNLASWFALRTAAHVGAPGVDLLATLGDAPMATLVGLCEQTGEAWLELLPSTKVDEQVLGAVSWLLPVLLLLPIGRRDADARAQAAPWWACLWFGLLVTLFAVWRYGFAPPVGSMREAAYGAFLLPIGAIGLLAVRFGAQLLPIAAGALVVLGVQDWHQGLEDLRLARMRVERTTARTLLQPATVEPVFGSAAVRATLIERGWIADRPSVDREHAAAAFSGPARPGLGRFDGGGPNVVRGAVRSSLRGATPAWVGVVARSPDGTARIVGEVWPRFAAIGREVPWQVTLEPPLAEGTRVRAVAFLPGEGAFAPLGPRFVLRGDALVADTGP